MAAEVLAHALLPTEAASNSAAKTTISAELKKVDDAVRLVIEFFSAVIYGHLTEIGAVRRTRTLPETPRK
jgi:hypothetical protein